MVVTLGQQYTVGEKPIVILYTYIVVQIAKEGFCHYRSVRSFFSVKQKRNNVYYVNLPLIITEVQKYFEILIFVNFLTTIKYFRTFWSPLRTSPILYQIIYPQFA